MKICKFVCVNIVLVKIECFLVLVPPSNVSISADPVDYVIEGSEQTITCKTDSYNPEASLSVRWWRNNELATRGVSWSEIEEGLYSGKRLTSVYRFTAERRDNTALYSCSPNNTAKPEDRVLGCLRSF